MFVWLCVPLVAEEVWPTLTSADGTKKMEARPVALEAGKIRFQKRGGKTFTAKPEVFSEDDRQQLQRWMQAMKSHPHSSVVQRVKASSPLRILFIGNSYSFHIPKQFANIASMNGKKVHVEQVTKGGWTLAKHAHAESTLKKIEDGKWDIVVLQEQSQVPAFVENQRSQRMDAAAKKLADAAREAGATPVFFLTWGRKRGDQQNAAVFPKDTMEAMQRRLNQGYANAAKHAGGAYVVPVGRVWVEVVKAKPGVSLYAPDGSHPAKSGNALGAYVFYTALFNESVRVPDKKLGKDADALAKLAGKAMLKPLPYPVPQAVPQP